MRERAGAEVGRSVAKDGTIQCHHSVPRCALHQPRLGCFITWSNYAGRHVEDSASLSSQSVKAFFPSSSPTEAVTDCGGPVCAHLRAGRRLPGHAWRGQGAGGRGALHATILVPDNGPTVVDGPPNATRRSSAPPAHLAPTIRSRDCCAWSWDLVSRLCGAFLHLCGRRQRDSRNRSSCLASVMPCVLVTWTS